MTEAIQTRLRSIATTLRSKPTALSDLIPILQEAADALDAAEIEAAAIGKIGRDAARLNQDYREALSLVMPADFRDWWKEKESDGPSVAASAMNQMVADRNKAAAECAEAVKANMVLNTELTKERDARKEAQIQLESFKEKLARSRLDLRREFIAQGWTAPGAE